MEALIPAFIAVALAEMGGKVQAISYEAGLKRGGKLGVLLALLLSSAVFYSIAAIGGVAIATMIKAQPKTLFLGLALVLAGLPMVLSGKPIEVKTGGFAGTLNLFVTKQFGDGAAFIVLAIAARSGMPVLAAAGGLAAVMMSGALPLLLERSWPEGTLLSVLRWIAAGLLTMAGVRLGLIALFPA